MPHTILDIAREAAARDNTAPPPTVLFGTNDKVATILRGAAKDTVRDLMRSTNWCGLSEFTALWAMVLKPGRYAYPLPTDYLRSIVNTEHRGGWPLGLIGPATPAVWSAWIFGGAAAVTASMGWRISNGALWVEPTPAAEELVTIEYISRYPVVSEVRAGDFDSQIPPQAVSPVVQRDGFIDGDVSEAVYDATDTGFAYGDAPGFDAAVWTASMSEILKIINPLSSVAPLPQVRRPEFTADTDKPAFEDDYLLSLGMTYRLRRALGLPYAEHAAEYESEMDMKINSDAGGARSFRIGNMGQEADCLPLGGGKWMVL